MSVEVIVPQENVNDEVVVVVGWLVGNGEPVKSDQLIVELETSKAVFDLEATADGILVHEYSLGDEVIVGKSVAKILSESEYKTFQRSPQEPVGKSAELSGTVHPMPLAGEVSIDSVRATPGASRLAASLGIEVAAIKKRGIIREKDVLAYQKSRLQEPVPDAESKKPTAVVPEVPKESLQKWKILDPQTPAGGGWLLYSRDFVARMLSGGYGSKVSSSLKSNLLTLPAMSCIAVAQGIIWVLAKIPVISTWVEILARVYKRNMFGFFLRGAYYKAKLGKMGPDNIIDQYVEIWGARNVRIGKGCHLDMYARLAAGESSQSQEGSIKIDDHVHIGPQCQLAGRGGITIGSYTAVTAGTKIFSATNVGDNPEDPYDLLPMSHAAPLGRQQIYEAPVQIGDHVFIGLNVCILPGVTIGRGAIVNSGSVIIRNVPEFAIMGGNPARIQGYRTPRPHTNTGPENRNTTSE